MPKTRAEIEVLLDQLDRYVADDLEGQDLDFREWDETSTRKAIRKVIGSAICMANGSGGTVLLGVADRRTGGRDRDLVGVPHDVDVNDLKRAVYDATDPKLTPAFEEVSVPEGTGRLLAMHVYAGMPPYTDTAGRGTIRMGKDGNRSPERCGVGCWRSLARAI